MKPSDEKKVIEMYKNSDLSLIKIADEFGYKSKDPVYKILKKHGVKKRRHIKNKLSKVEIYQILNLYEYGMSCCEISKYYNVSSSTINRKVFNSSIKARKNGRVYEFNEEYFDSINSPNKAYLLGFIWADGSVGNNTLSVVIHKKDIEVLEFFKEELETDAPISHVKGKPHVRISICSKYMVDKLVEIGCNHNKTLDLKIPNIKTNLMSHFIRGFMDGDGCISIKIKENNNGLVRKYLSLSFVGTLEMISELNNIFKTNYKINLHRNAYHINIGKKKDYVRILEWIYKDAELFMSRKYNIYQEYINYLGEC